MTNLAKFDVDGDGGDYGYELTPGVPARLKLRLDPAQGVQRVLFQVYDPDAFDASQGIGANPPRSSNGAPTVVLDNEDGDTGQAVNAATPTSEVAFPAQTGVHSWITRCIVNGGYRVSANGVAIPDPNLVYERLLYLPASIAGVRKIIATESTQGGQEGWAEVINALIDGIAVSVDDRFDDIESRLDDTEARLDDVEERVDAIEDRPGALSIHQSLTASSGDYVIDPNLGTDITLTLNGSLTSLTMLALDLAANEASTIKLAIIQGSGGTKLVVSWVGFGFIDGTPPTLATTAGQVNALAAFVNGTENIQRFVPSPFEGPGFLA